MSSAIEISSDFFELDPKDEAVSDFVSELGRVLQAALLNYKRNSKATQQALAVKLGIDRSRVNRCFSGYANLTASSIAELAWALDCKPVIILKPLAEEAAGQLKVTHFEVLEKRAPTTIITMSRFVMNERDGAVWMCPEDTESKAFRPRTSQAVNQWQRV